MAREAKPKPEFTVIRDTREQKGWTFDPQEFSSQTCAGTIISKLDTGDYTLLNYEKVLCIERKGGVAEIATNLFDDRFERELERMLKFPHRLLLCEFTLQDVMDFPARSGIPHNRRDLLRITPELLLKRLAEVLLLNQVPVIFAGHKGKEFAVSLFKRVAENVPKPASN